MAWAKKRKKENGKTSSLANWDQELQRIRELAPPPPKEAIYPYLQAVYRRARVLGDIDKPTEKKFNKSADGFAKQIKWNRMRLLIELTAPSHMKPKMKWKYSQTLMYAYRSHVKSVNLIAFIKDEGGINKCVDKYQPKKE